MISSMFLTFFVFHTLLSPCFHLFCSPFLFRFLVFCTRTRAHTTKHNTRHHTPLKTGFFSSLTGRINGANARTQRDKGMKDSADLVTSDISEGGAKKPELAKLLCENSGTDVEWLMDKFNLDLSLVARLDGGLGELTDQEVSEVCKFWDVDLLTPISSCVVFLRVFASSFKKFSTRISFWTAGRTSCFIGQDHFENPTLLIQRDTQYIRHRNVHLFCKD